jgi:hypothetical protein
MECSDLLCRFHSWDETVAVLFLDIGGTLHVRKPLVQEENSICFRCQQEATKKKHSMNLDGKH